MPSAIWIAILRQTDGEISVAGIVSLSEAFDASYYLSIRMRYNLDMRLVTLRLPTGTRREQVDDALAQLSCDERRQLYYLPQHKMAG